MNLRFGNWFSGEAARRYRNTKKKNQRSVKNIFKGFSDMTSRKSLMENREKEKQRFADEKQWRLDHGLDEKPEEGGGLSELA